MKEKINKLFMDQLKKFRNIVLNTK